ncbi:MAG: hypothetical protein ABI907_10210 [Ramlibacter sp.]
MMLALPLQGFAAASMALCGVPAPRHQHHAQHEAHGHQAKADADTGKSGHTCAVCAACCNAAAFNPFPQPLEFGAPPHAAPAEPLVLIRALAVRLPDKPPRA